MTHTFRERDIDLWYLTHYNGKDPIKIHEEGYTTQIQG